MEDRTFMHTADIGFGPAPKGAPAGSSAVKPSREPAGTREPLPGVQVTEFEATLPIEMYGELFKDRP
jgi:hypothetical protein